MNRNLAATLRASGPSLVSDPKTLKQITEIVLSIITKNHPCQKDFGDEEDLGQLEETSEYDWLTIDTAMDVVAGLAVALGESFGELWKIFNKPILKYASGSEAIERSETRPTVALLNCFTAVRNDGERSSAVCESVFGKARMTVRLPSLRAQRSNPGVRDFSGRGGSLDCFAALAMTAKPDPVGWPHSASAGSFA